MKLANTVNQQWTSSEKGRKGRNSILGISASNHWKSSCGNFSMGNKVLSVIFHKIKQWEVLIFHQMITHPIQEKLSVFQLISIQNTTMMSYRNDSLNGHYSDPFLFSGLGSAWMTAPTIPQDHEQLKLLQQLKLFKHNHSCAANSPRLSMAIVAHNIPNSVQFCINCHSAFIWMSYTSISISILG